MKSGEDKLRDYSFGPKKLLHKFCTECGSSVWFDPRMMACGEGPPDLLGINVRHVIPSGVRVLLLNAAGSHVP